MTLRASLLLALIVVTALPGAAQTPAIPPGPAPAPAPVPATGLITGRVLNADGAPIASAIVSLSGRGQPVQQSPRVLTDAEGRFFFSDLAAGTYTASATKPGWIPGAFGRRRPNGNSIGIDLTDGERRGDISIVLWRYAVISGRVVDDAGDPIVDLDVRAFLRSFVAGRRRMAFTVRARTDDRGLFRFASLLPGDYLIVVPATVTSEPATMAGAIRAEGETPRAYLQTMTAVGTAPMLFDRADVPARGDRLVSSIVALPGPPTADGAWLTYPTTFFPSTSAIGSATAVRAESGRERSGVDVTLRLVATFQVSGRLMGADGAAAYHAVHLLPADSADAPLFDVGTAITDQSGSFTFDGVPPGQYVTRVVRTPWPTGDGQRLALAGGTGAIPYVATVGRGPSAGQPPLPTEPLLYADQPITVADRHVRELSVTMRAGPRVSGRTEFNGSAPRPTAAEFQLVGVVLEPAGGQQYSAIPSGQFSADGQFATPGHPPGRYLIRAPAFPSGWTATSVMYHGRDVSETPIDLTSDIEGVVVTYADRPAKIDGTVEGIDRRTGAIVLLFPTDPAAWTDYGRNSRRVRSTPASATGTFTLPAPPDGEYFLVAILDEQAADWQNPAVLRKLSAIADRIQVRDGQPVTRALPLRRLQ